MVRRKQVLQTDETTIQINLVGHKSLLPHKHVTICATLEHTWIQVLKDELGIELDPSSGVFVCTAQYTPSTPKPGHGWRGEITETVKKFVSKFERKKIYYLVRLCDPKHFSSMPAILSGQQAANNGISHSPTSVSAAISALSRGPQIVISSHGAHVVEKPTEGTCFHPSTLQVLQQSLKRNNNQTPTLAERKQPRRKAAQIALQNFIKLESSDVEEFYGTEAEAEEVEIDAKPFLQEHLTETPTNQTTALEKNDDIDEDFDDNLSLRSAAFQEENELSGMGIRIEDTRTLVQSRAQRFSNAFYLRVKNETRKLQRNNLWDRNVKHSPLACYLLQELLKD